MTEAVVRTGEDLRLTIPLPAKASEGTPNTVSYRWCNALFDALLPLREFKLQDGSDALFITVAAGYNIVTHWDSAFTEQQEPWDLLEQNDPPSVMRIMLMQSRETCAECSIVFSLEDFAGDARGARDPADRTGVAHRSHRHAHRAVIRTAGSTLDRQPARRS